jgi:phage major head subunit gpT-like protein
MAIVKSDIPGLLRAGLKTTFFQTFTETAANWDKVTTLIMSDKDTEQYAWLGALPGVREFLDERMAQDMGSYSYAIQNRTWESTIAVDRAVLEDDLYGQIALRIKQMAMVAKTHLDSITFGLLGAGFVNPCYDGLPFFGAHPLGSVAGVGGPQSNTATDALSSASLQAAITAMMRFTDDQGRPAGVMPNLLVIPPELYWEATQLLNSSFFPDPAPFGSQDLAINPLKGMLTVLTTPYLSSQSNWFLLDTKRIVKALVLQMRKDFEFNALEGNSEEGFMRDQYLYGVRARYNVGYGDWRAAYGAKVG